MNYDIFTNEKEKAEARKSLRDLSEHPGWKFIVRALQANVDFVAESLQTRTDFSSLDEVYALQERISDLKQYQQLPENLLAEIPIAEDEEEDPDPYSDK